MAESPHRAGRYLGLLVFVIPAGGAWAQAVLATSRPELVPFVRSWQATPEVAAGASAAMVLVLWLALAAVPLGAKLGWRQALTMTAPALLPFLLLFAVRVPGIEERAGAGLVPMLAGVAWGLWGLSAVAMLVWVRTGRLPRPDLAPQPRRPEAWARVREGGDALLPLVLAAVVVPVRLLDLHLGLGTLDQRALAYAAERVTEGSVLYRDVFAPLAPGPVYLVAGLFQLLQPTLLVARGPEVAYAVLLAVAGYAAARQFTTPLFAFAAALLAGCTAAPSLALALILLAFVCAFRAAWSRDAAWSAAGLLTGVAMLFDPLVGGLGAASLVVTLVLRQVPGVRGRMAAPGVDMGLGWTAAVRYLLVAAIPVALAATYFGWARALPDFWRGAVAARYGALEFVLPQSAEVRLEATGWSGVMATAASARGLVVPGVLLLGLLRLGQSLVGRRWGELDMVILGVVLLGALLLTVGPGGTAAMAAVPALLVGAHLLGWAWHGVLRVLGGESGRLALVRLDGYAVGGLAVVVLLVAMMAPPLERIRGLFEGTPGTGHRAVRDVLRASGIKTAEEEASALERTLELVVRRAQAMRPILCLPDCPEVYFLADRDSPTRFIVAAEFTTPADDAEMAQAIAEGKPAVVVLHGEAGDEERLAETLTRVRERYRRAARFGAYEVRVPRP